MPKAPFHPRSSARRASPSSCSMLLRSTLLLCMFLIISGCEGFGSPKKPVPEPTPPPPKVEVLPSPAPIERATKSDIHYAQSALNHLGYTVGQVDGIWGPRSAQAVRNFEQMHRLHSADGHLSRLNLYMLEKTSKLEHGHIVAKPVSRKGIRAKLDSSIPLSSGPQLVIIDRVYAILAKPNPFSQLLIELPVGTGVYIIRLQEGWYEVESEDRIHGYIKAN